MKFKVELTLTVPIGRLLQKRLLNLQSVTEGLSEDVEAAMQRSVGSFPLSHSIHGCIKVSRVKVVPVERAKVGR